jgi:ABC-type Mn2+/Zn2+ transport system ATPase subunit
MMEYAAEISNAFIKAGQKIILENISLKIKPGEFTAILGPNGAGKTTLIKALLGFSRLNSGKAKLLGCDTGGTGINKVRSRTAYVPQSVDVDRFFPIKAMDVIMLGSCREAAEETARELKIQSLLSQPFGLLSGGEKQKVLLAMALARKPEILFLDEPNLNLDMKAYRNFLEFTDRLHRKRGLTVVFITHLINQLPASCRRVIVMKNGCIDFESSAKRLLKCKKAPELIYG